MGMEASKIATVRQGFGWRSLICVCGCEKRNVVGLSSSSYLA